MKLLLLSMDSATGEANADLAEAFAELGHQPHILIYVIMPDLQARLEADYRRRGLSYSVKQDRSLLNPASGTGVQRFKRLSPRNQVAVSLYGAVRSALMPFRRRIMDAMGEDVREGVGFFVDKLSDQADARDVIAREASDALVLTHEYAGHFSTALAIMARRAGVACVIAPALFPDPAALAARLAELPRHAITNWRARLVGRLFPRWRRTTPAGAILRMEWWRIITLKLLGLSRGDPWVHQSGPIEAICLPDPVIADLYLEHGFPRSKLRITGSALQDRFHRIRRSREMARANRPRLLVAVPPDQYAAPSSGWRFLSYRALLESLRDALTQAEVHYDITLAVHPKQSPKPIAAVFAERFPIADKPTADLLPAHDLFLSYLGSSTLIWGPWARVPAIAWDPYGFLRADPEAAGYYGEVGAIRAVEAGALQSALLDAARPGALERWRETINALSDIPDADGGAAQRIIGEIRRSDRTRSRQPWLRERSEQTRAA